MNVTGFGHFGPSVFQLRNLDVQTFQLRILLIDQGT